MPLHDADWNARRVSLELALLASAEALMAHCSCAGVELANESVAVTVEFITTTALEKTDVN